MRVNCLAQEHNAVPRPVLEPAQPNQESTALTIRPPRSLAVLCDDSTLNIIPLCGSRKYSYPYHGGPLEIPTGRGGGGGGGLKTQKF